MTPHLAVNDVISAQKDAEIDARLSFIGMDQTRRLFGVCPRLVAEEIGESGRLFYGGTATTASPRESSQSPAHQPNASVLIGCFELGLDQTIDPEIPRVIASPFEVLGEDLHVYGQSNEPHLSLDRINVSLVVPEAGGLVRRFLELQPATSDLDLPTNGALVVDGRGRGVCILVGRTPLRYLAVSLEECLVSLRLRPVGAAGIAAATEDVLPDAAELDSEELPARPTPTFVPQGQLLEIMTELGAGL